MLTRIIDATDANEKPSPLETLRCTSSVHTNMEIESLSCPRFNGGDMTAAVDSKWCIFCRRVLDFLQNYKALLLGQVLSFLLACSGAAQATLHFECSLSAPAFCAGLFYAVLSLHLIPLYYEGRKDSISALPVYSSVSPESDECTDNECAAEERSLEYWFLGCIRLSQPWYRYFIVAFLDVQATYVTVLAFRYTTLTSISLFDALAIPSSMVLSRCFMSRRFTGIHLLGVVCCMIGVGANALADFESDRDTTDVDSVYPYKLSGDVLAAMGGILYGLVNVASEAVIRTNGSPTEYLGLIGFFGALLSLIQSSLLEGQAVHDFFNGVPDFDGKTCNVESGFLLLTVFVLVNAAGYIGTARFLLISEATLFNLSLLTGDLWSVAFAAIAENIIPHLLFWGALTSIVVGVVIYETAPSPIRH